MFEFNRNSVSAIQKFLQIAIVFGFVVRLALKLVSQHCKIICNDGFDFLLRPILWHDELLPIKPDLLIVGKFALAKMHQPGQVYMPL